MKPELDVNGILEGKHGNRVWLAKRKNRTTLPLINADDT